MHAGKQEAISPVRREDCTHKDRVNGATQAIPGKARPAQSLAAVSYTDDGPTLEALLEQYLSAEEA